QVTIYAEKPGIVIGKGGKVVRQLTQDLATDFGVESPQIEVQQVPNPSFNAQIMAERLANALERGWYFRKAGSSIIRRVMESGALGCEVIIAGKLTGARARVQKFTEGYIKHSGEPVNTIVEKGFAVAIKKLGVIGVQVRIIPPESKLPDHFEMIVPKQKLVRKEEIAITPVGEEIEEEDLAMDLDEFDDVVTPEDR
ncbi:MAG TPA: 30S ribosomal protein S3, partial [Methanoregulaceae archaeon]|nr:30S ribosomal protein S3 [Methanoregulaceae archaeon]